MLSAREPEIASRTTPETSVSVPIHPRRRRGVSTPYSSGTAGIRSLGTKIYQRLKGVYTTMWVRMGGLTEASAAVSPMTRV